MSAMPSRILWLSTVMPAGRKTGGEIASINLLEAVAEVGTTVDCIAYRRAGETGDLPPGFESPCDLVIESAEAPRETAEWLARAALAGRPFSVQKYVTAPMRDLVRRKLATGVHDLVVVDHAQIGWLLDFVPPHLPTVFVAHNVEHRLYEGRARDLRREGGVVALAKSAVYAREARLMRALETELAGRCSAVWTLSADDASYFREVLGLVQPAANVDGKSGGESRVRSVSIPGQTFAPAAVQGSSSAAEADRPARIDVGLLGSWVWDVNRDGLEWFLNHVVPLLPRNLDIVVGGKSDRAPGAREGNVRFAGFVPDAGAFLRSARVVVIPTTIGSGIQIKTIETIGLGVPLVATKIALRGIDDKPDYVVEASVPEAMAAAIRRTLENPMAVNSEGQAWLQARRKRFVAELGAALSGLGDQVRRAA